MSDPKKNSPKKELTTEQRMLLAFALMGVVLLVSQYLIPAPPESPQKKAAPAATTSKQTAEPVKTAEAPPPAPSTPAPTGQVNSSSEETIRVETDLYQIDFSNRGAVIKSWVLKNYQDSTGKPLELLNARAIGKTGYPFSIRLKNGSSAQKLNQALFRATLSADKLRIDFEYADSEWHARKSFAFRNKSHLAEVSSEVSQSGRGKPHLLSWRGGFGDETVIGAASNQHSVFYDLNEGKLNVLEAGKAKDGPVVNRGNYSFAGIEDMYFAAVALPESTDGFEIHTISDLVPNAIDAKEEPNAGVAVGGEHLNRFSLFVGPKDTDLLRSISPRLEQLVDWGWFAIIAKPLFLSLNWLHDKYLPNYGWCIILITVIINFIMLPLKVTSLKSMKKMQGLQPHVKAINEKYKGLSLRDPKKAEQNQEIMELYKKHGVNPMGGCVPMVLQIPFFFAFYKVLSVAIEIRGADWLWVTDLSRPEMLAIRPLPIAMVASQFFMQKMTPSTAADPAQQRIMLLMPLFFGFMFYNFSSGLVLYWLTGNVVGIAQQLFFNKFIHTAAPEPPPVSKPARKSRK
ncbi:MAG: membrane protein insertase YidC [Acidimicrobiia bacterium]|nr:membrane protein insertase YidC [Acidimicrobiia bacterium]